MEAFITDLFMRCVYILQVIGGSPGEFGYGYYVANIVVFVVLQPGLILLFFMLWRKNEDSEDDNLFDCKGKTYA